MTHREKEALLKRIYALPTEWADAGGSYGKGGPVGSEDTAMLWPEAVIDAINQFAADANVARKDPITGLVPCGCGGVVEQEDFHDGFFPYSRVTCRGCWTETTRCRCTTEEAHEMARIGWNTSHGYTAPSRPGAIVPDAGEMAPNGDEGEES